MATIAASGNNFIDLSVKDPYEPKEPSKEYANIGRDLLKLKNIREKAPIKAEPAVAPVSKVKAPEQEVVLKSALAEEEKQVKANKHWSKTTIFIIVGAIAIVIGVPSMLVADQLKDNNMPNPLLTAAKSHESSTQSATSTSAQNNTSGASKTTSTSDSYSPASTTATPTVKSSSANTSTNSNSTASTSADTNTNNPSSGSTDSTTNPTSDSTGTGPSGDSSTGASSDNGNPSSDATGGASTDSAN